MIMTTIIVTNGKVYFPTNVKTSAGYFFDTEPILITDLNLESVAGVIEKKRVAANPVISDTEFAQLRTKKLPILNVSKKRSQKELAKTGTSYAISWTEDYIFLSISSLDRKNRWVYDAEKGKHFPIDTNNDDLASVIIEDAMSRPEVL